MGTLLALLTGVGPIINKLIDAHEVAAANQDHQAMAIIQSRIDALKGAYGLAATAAGQIIVTAFALVVFVYFAKCVVWDTVLGYYTHGTTPALHGTVAAMMNLVVTFVFGHGLISRIVK